MLVIPIPRIQHQSKVISSGQESSPRQNPDPKYEAMHQMGYKLLVMSFAMILNPYIYDLIMILYLISFLSKEENAMIA